MDGAAFLQPLPVAAAFLRSGRVELFDPADAPDQHGHDLPVRLVELSLHRTSLHPVGTPPCTTSYGRTRRSRAESIRNLESWERTSGSGRQTRLVIHGLFERAPNRAPRWFSIRLHNMPSL